MKQILSVVLVLAMFTLPLFAEDIDRYALVYKDGVVLHLIVLDADDETSCANGTVFYGTKQECLDEIDSLGLDDSILETPDE